VQVPAAAAAAAVAGGGGDAAAGDTQQRIAHGSLHKAIHQLLCDAHAVLGGDGGGGFAPSRCELLAARRRRHHPLGNGVLLLHGEHGLLPSLPRHDAPSVREVLGRPGPQPLYLRIAAGRRGIEPRLEVSCLLLLRRGRRRGAPTTAACETLRRSSPSDCLSDDRVYDFHHQRVASTRR
jgi:hypothetical protein